MTRAQLTAEIEELRDDIADMQRCARKAHGDSATFRGLAADPDYSVQRRQDYAIGDSMQAAMGRGYDNQIADKKARVAELESRLAALDSDEAGAVREMLDNVRDGVRI